jgi:alpha-galactosidase
VEGLGSFPGLRDAGYTWVNTDDGWDTKKRNSDGTLQPDPLKFPKGIKGLVQELSGASEI